MSDISLMQSVLVLGGTAVALVAAAFTVYWNLLGKKHVSISLQKKSQQVRSVARSVTPKIQHYLVGETVQRSTVSS